MTTKEKSPKSRKAKTKLPTELESQDTIAEDIKKIIKLDSKAVDLLEEIKEYLSMKNITDVIKGGISTLRILAELEKSGAGLYYKQGGKLIKITVRDSKANDEALNLLTNL